MEGRTTSQGTACSSDPFFISADAGAPDRRSTGNGRQRNVADMRITPATEEGHMIINGQPEDIATPLSVDELIARKGLNAGRVAVEVNGAIVPRDKRAQTMLSGTDTVEIVTFVQGG